jgi:hypothetical protein
MSSLCTFCNSSFANKYSLSRHLNDKKCKSEILTELLNDWEALHNLFINKCESKNIIGNHNTNNHNTNNTNIKVENVNVILDINTINKLTTDHIAPEKMKDFIEGYSYDKLPLFLSEYIKDIICNKALPQNHSVKYLTKNPPRFNSLVENDNGERINVIKNLKDSCEVLSQPVLVTLKKKLNECLKKYKNDEEFNVDCEVEIKGIRKELNKESVKKALRSVLQNDILTDIEMKLNF